MAKMISEITAGLIVKEMTPIGFVLINKDNQPLLGRPVYTSYGIANRVRIDYNSDLRIRALYIEKCER